MNRRAKFSSLCRLDDTIRRERLFDQMMRSIPATANTTILVAPAGYGKTTLLAQLADLLRRDGTCTVWLNCDPQDRQPNVFLQSLKHAYASAGVDTGCAFPDPLDTGVNADGVARVAIFVDDYEAASSPDTDELLRDIACALGGTTTLYIGCRDIAKTALMDLALQGVARIVDASELKFNAQETRLLLADRVDSDALARIDDLADGWAVVLQLIRLGLSGGFKQAWDGGETAGMLPSDRIFSYLATEVWDRLPVPLREFMEVTAPLTYIDVPSANWLRGTADSATLISQLRDLHPIVSIDLRQLQARLHPLLRDFLLYRLSCHDPAVLPALHTRAAEYFEARGDLFESVTHAVQSEDPDLAARIIERAGAVRLGVPDGMWHVKSLLSLLPRKMVQARSRLRIMEICVSIVDDNPAENRFLLDRLESDIVAAGEDDDMNPVWIDLRCARCVEMVNLAERCIVYPHAERLEALRKDATTRIGQDSRLLGLVSIIEILLVQRHRDVLKAELRADALGRLNHRFRFTANSVWHPIYEAQNDYHAGRLGSAEHRLRGLLTKEFDLFRLRQSAFGQMTYALLGRVHFARGELEEAMTCFSCIPDAQSLPILEVSEGAIVCRAFCEAALGRAAAALERLRLELVRAREAQRPACACLINAARVELLCRTGAVAQAEQVYEELLDELREGGGLVLAAQDDVPWCVRQALARARFYIAMAGEKFAQAQRIAMDFEHAARQQRRVISEVMARVLHADALFGQEKTELALDVLSEALALCQLPPPAQFFLEHRMPLPAIVGPVATSGGRSGAAAAVVMRVWEREFATSVASLGILSRRECEVIVHLAQGHATKRIARSLAVSPETIKFHLKSVYGKLGVNSRQAAVSEAHRLVLIQRNAGQVSGFSERANDAFAVRDETED